MEDKIFFLSGDKSFELIDAGDGWYVLIKRGRRFSSSIKVDEENLWWVCDALKQASNGVGNFYRRWGKKIQEYIYRVYQKYNIYGRFVRIETRLGDKKIAVIIPEPDYNRGWGDIAGKILRFLDKSYTVVRRMRPNIPKMSSYLGAAAISQ